LYEGQFIMALATTSSIWRSTGGDTTRTATAGSMEMIVPFYIANVAATSNVVVSSTLANTALILPAGATVLAVNITATGTGSADLGFTPLIGVGPGQTTTLGTNVPQAFLANASTATRAAFQIGTTGSGAYIGNVANVTNLVVVTSAANGVASGSVTGSIRFYVADPSFGEENV
jgi:hypothetical protein